HCDVDDGLCFGDVDGDGRLDLVIASSDQGDMRRPVGLYLNQTAEQRWLRVQLIGKPGNAAATGAKIRLFESSEVGKTRPGKAREGGRRAEPRLFAYEQVAVWGRQSFHSYYAARHTQRHFGLGRRAAVDVSVEFYPSGRRVERKNVPADGTVVIAEASP